MEIQFCGAAREVTGSSHLITLKNGYKILLDCGLYQGYKDELEDFNRQFFFKPAEVDCLILSHAHIDHTGKVPKLVKDGFRGRILSTHATRSLCAIMLLDSAMIQEREAEWENKRQAKRKKNKKRIAVPLYTREDVTPTMLLFETYGYEKWINVTEGVRLLYRDAGHILGSATVTLEITEDGKKTMLGFSGDVGRPDRPILKDPAQMPELDILICESTYGNRDHIEKPAEKERFLNIIKKTCVEKRGKLIIPAFSVGRTQEIVYMLDKMESAGELPKIPVFVDSPLAVNATTVFGSHPECYDNDLHEYMLVDENPFGFNSLTYVRNVEVSKSLNTTNEPCIIISSSGMMNAGRVRHHLFNNIDSDQNTLLIVGYCSPDTPGGMLKNGVEQLKLFGEWKPVNIEIEVMDSFSAHADRQELLDFISNQKKTLRKIFLVHGDYDAQQAFQTLLKENGYEDVAIPKLGSVSRFQ